MAKASTKTVAPKPAIETPTQSGTTTLPQAIIPRRPHNMPRRLLNVPASRTDTSGKE